MRMLNDLNDVLSAEEVIYLDASYCIDRSDGISSETNPTYFGVEVTYANQEESDGLGEYVLDGTPETYKKALANFNSICRKAAELGYFCLSDFQNFRLF